MFIRDRGVFLLPLLGVIWEEGVVSGTSSCFFLTFCTQLYTILHIYLREEYWRFLH